MNSPGRYGPFAPIFSLLAQEMRSGDSMPQVDLAMINPQGRSARPNRDSPQGLVSKKVAVFRILLCFPRNLCQVKGMLSGHRGGVSKFRCRGAETQGNKRSLGFLPQRRLSQMVVRLNCPDQAIVARVGLHSTLRFWIKGHPSLCPGQASPSI
jgi:hypothetical protein